MVNEDFKGEYNMSARGRIIAFITLWFIACADPGAMALEKNKAEKGGFSGSVFLGSGWVWGETSLSDTNGKGRLIELTDDGKKVSSPIPFFFGYLGYDFARSGTRITLGVEDGTSPMLSLSQKAGFLGKIETGLKYEKTDVWENPYMTGVRRTTTDKETVTARFSIDELLKTPFMISYEFSSTRVDNDLSGSMDPDLKRDGDSHVFGFGTPVFFKGPHIAFMDLSYEDANTEGESNRFNGYGLGLYYSYDVQKWKFETTLAHNLNRYEKIHPIFGEKRKDKTYFLEASFTRNRPLGLENTFISTRLLFMKQDSNIGFYDESAIIPIVGIGYRF